MLDVSVLEAQAELQRLAIEYADSGLSNGEIYEKIEANHPAVVDAYIESQRRSLITTAIWTIVGQSNRNRRHAAIFAEVGDRRAVGEDLLLNNLPSADGSRKILALMTKVDLLYSADMDEAKANGLIGQADFKRALAKRVPKGKTVGDVFTAEQIAEYAQRLFGVSE